MDINYYLNIVFQAVIIPLFAILTKFLVDFIKLKAQEIISTLQNEQAVKYVRMIEATVINCVKTTNQTYVDKMKDENVFDKEKQAIAFKMTYDAVMEILTEDAKEYITTGFADGKAWLISLIESAVRDNKDPAVETTI